MDGAIADARNPHGGVVNIEQTTFESIRYRRFQENS